MIALSLSGGGSRATGFHLGALECLERLGLRNDIGIISSVSGGSLVGTTYTVAMHSGEPFDVYLQRIYDGFKGAQMVDWVLKELAEGDFPIPSRRRSVITALANVYDRKFFSGTRLHQFRLPGKGSVREAVFNATDFMTGDAFRFLIHGGVGNTNYDTMRDDDEEVAAGDSVPFWVPEEDAAHIRVADVMAASSCIPGGLEPFYFPQDFDWNSDGGKEAYQRVLRRVKSRNVDSIPLMDGGVYDNQNIESTLMLLDRIKSQGASAATLPEARAESRSPSAIAVWLDKQINANPPDELDLIIISDTSIQLDPVYRAAYEPGDRPYKLRSHKPRGWLTVAGLNAIWWVVAGLCLTTLGAITYHIYVLEFSDAMGEIPWGVSDIFLIFMPFLLSMAAVFVLFWYRRNFNAMVRGLNRILQIEGTPSFMVNRKSDSWVYIRTLRISLIGDMVSQRMSSMFTLVNDVFMDRIRALGYTLLRNSPLHDKVIANELRDLRKTHTPPPGMEWLSPSDKMKKLVKRAEGMPTAFWFEHDDDLEVLVACGQITTYYNLLKYYGAIAAQDGVITEEEQRVFDEGRRLWERLKEDPKCMLPFNK